MIYDSEQSAMSVKTISSLQKESILRDVRVTLKLMEMLGVNPPAGTAVVYTLVKSFEEVAVTYYSCVETASEQHKPIVQRRHLFNAVEKLAAEWARLLNIVQSAVFAPSKNEAVQNALAVLQPVLAGARAALNLPDSAEIAIVPHVGRHFELVHFEYAPDIHLIGIPLYALHTPWEWSAIWHELAGMLIAKSYADVREDEWQPNELFRALHSPADELVWPADAAKAPRAAQAAKSIAAGRWDKFWTHWGAKFGDDKPKLKTLNHNWRRNWIEELVEDACSVMSLGPLAYQIMIDLFARKYADLDKPRDTRHPPPTLRLEVAYQLLKKMKMQFTNQEAPSQESLAVEFGGRFDPLADAHDNLPGAAEIAAWIWKNHDRLVKQPFNWLDQATTQNKTDAVGRLVDSLAALFKVYAQDRRTTYLDALARQVILDANQLAGQIAALSLVANNQAALWDNIWQRIINQVEEGVRQQPTIEFEAINSQAHDLMAAIDQHCDNLKKLEELEFSSSDLIDVWLATCGQLQSAAWWQGCPL